MHQGYDLIGDIHGCGKTLIKLLKQMGYKKKSGVYQHKSRKAIFLGDIVDRGPNIRLACQTVYDMVEQGHAYIIMGNHEYNLVTYCTPAPGDFDRPFLREHTERNNFIVQETINQFANHSEDFQQYLNWFADLPLFLDFDHFRTIHACWDQNLIDQYVQRYGGNQLPRRYLAESVDTSSFLYQFLDRSLRGTSLELPEGRSIESRDGMIRRFFRAKFWEKNPQVYQDVVFQPDPLPEDLQQRQLSAEEQNKLVYYSDQEKPLFLGHYWMWGVPATITPNIACLDYSAVKYGRLVAYRMDREHSLSNTKFTWVSVEKEERAKR